MSLIKSNEQLRTEILKRIKELDYTQSFICQDAEERGFTIRASHLSNYLSGKSESLSEAGIIWLSLRLGIYINILIGKPVVNKSREVVYEVPKFNEIEAIKALKKFYPETKDKKNGKG